MTDFQKQMEKYAELLVQVGVNVQPGQVLYVESPIESADFARLVTAKAYQTGAKYVQVNWRDETVVRMRYDLAGPESFAFYPPWTAHMMESIAESGGAVLLLDGENPNLYEGVDPAKISASRKAAAAARRNYLGYVRTNRISWCIVNVPSQAWADQVFADRPQEERVNALWESIFRMNHIDEEDPVAAWQRHTQHLRAVTDKLNAKQYRRLHYKAPGTDLTVELAPGHIWLGGGQVNQSGIPFVANMPTEEVYTMPHRAGTNGTVSSTRPFVLNGQLVDRFSLTFREGRVVDFAAETGYEALKQFLDADEGTRYLGEVAIVPHDSPISRLNRVFYNVGIDENASCHFALGNAYPTNLQGGAGLSDEELLARGANVSMQHEDFMVGSAELSIDAEHEDGTIEPLLRNGSWVIR
ncbi:aminopeptidase [Paenibacillus sp. Y412MC10]|uniref:aminopeptidase n=1 Tax=Geobacillus sp. (strain Y412MC10) TaxID=481743 RepID=UPI0011AA6B4B|nr:aminopeptidase [Paenibacillus sp. Y412MC10]